MPYHYTYIITFMLIARSPSPTKIDRAACFLPSLVTARIHHYVTAAPRAKKPRRVANGHREGSNCPQNPLRGEASHVWFPKLHRGLALQRTPTLFFLLPSSHRTPPTRRPLIFLAISRYWHTLHNSAALVETDFSKVRKQRERGGEAKRKQRLLS